MSLVRNCVGAVNKPDSPSSKSTRQRSNSGVVTAFNAGRRSASSRRREQQADCDTASTEISEQALEDLKANIDQLPEINATRVVQLHQRIMAAEYVINLDRLTDKLLALESALLDD